MAMSPAPASPTPSGDSRPCKWTLIFFSIAAVVLLPIGIALLAVIRLVLTIAIDVGSAARQARLDATNFALTSVRSALANHRLQNSGYPPGLASLSPAALGGRGLPLMDAWKNPLVYSATPQSPERPYTLYSAGPDGVANTSDDIDVWMLPP